MTAVLASKHASLNRCLNRIRDVWERPSDLPFEEDLDKQELIILNLTRAFEILLDMANHLVRIKKLGWPNNSAETFNLLEEAGLITADMKTNLKRGNAMRNVMVHRYEDIDPGKVRNVVENYLDEILESGRTLFSLGPDSIVSQELPTANGD